MLGKILDGLEDGQTKISDQLAHLTHKVSLLSGNEGAVGGTGPTCEVFKIHDAGYDDVDRKTPKICVEWVYERNAARPRKVEDRCEWIRLDQADGCVKMVDEFVDGFSKSKRQPGIAPVTLYKAWEEAKKGFEDAKTATSNGRKRSREGASSSHGHGDKKNSASYVKSLATGKRQYATFYYRLITCPRDYLSNHLWGESGHVERDHRQPYAV
eukprot:jgi/Mesvir1/19857/Mv13147-RA.1